MKRGLVPGGQDSLAEVGEQHLGRRVSRLADSGANRPGGHVLQKSERGLKCELEEQNCPDRLKILTIPKLHCNTGAGSTTFTKPNIVLNVGFVLTNDRKESDAAARTDCPLQ